MSQAFSPQLFEFLRDLRTHNSREWLSRNVQRYEADVEAPVRAFVGQFAPRLAEISAHLSASARPRGGSFAGIEHRTRFPASRAPFRTDVILRFPHRSRRIKMPPMFYLHLEPGRSFGGGGMYHPDPASLNAIREAIDKKRDDWRGVLSAAPVLHAESLTRTPTAYPSDHPFATDLKRKGHVVMTHYSDDDVTSPAFLERFVTTCETAAPLVRFLSRALGLAW
jgi:uncharacterized protein (TIGR02453 family)